jgi:hypothetical protein
VILLRRTHPGKCRCGPKDFAVGCACPFGDAKPAIKKPGSEPGFSVSNERLST